MKIRGGLPSLTDALPSLEVPHLFQDKLEKPKRGLSPLKWLKPGEHRSPSGDKKQSILLKTPLMDYWSKATRRLVQLRYDSSLKPLPDSALHIA